MRRVAIGSITAKRARIVRNIRIVSYADCDEDKGKRENPCEARCPVPDEIDADLNQQRKKDKCRQCALRG